MPQTPPNTFFRSTLLQHASPGPRPGGRAWRLLAWFWAAVLIIIATLGCVLAVLGAPDQPGLVAQAGEVAPSTAVRTNDTSASPIRMAETPPASVEGAPLLRPDDEIKPPLPALLEPSQSFPGAFLPRVGGNGRRPMQAYRRQAPAPNGHPRIAVLVTGLGADLAQSHQVTQLLPGAVSLAYTPYAGVLDDALDDARAHGHEYFLSLPMQPQGYPLHEEGLRSLLLDNDAAHNRQNLEWSLTRLQGYIGVTNALDGLLGEEYVQQADAATALAGELQRRGLIFLDARQDVPVMKGVVGRGVDIRITDASALEQLAALARARGQALGYVPALNMDLIQRLKDWTHGLEGKGLQLVPVSALADPSDSPEDLP